MTTTAKLFFRKAIAIGQKTSDDSSAYGQGFNYKVEVGVPLTGNSHAQFRTAVESVLARIDHRALGVDLDLGFDPTTAQLCKWIQREIANSLGEASVEVHLVRGDGLAAKSPAL